MTNDIRLRGAIPASIEVLAKQIIGASDLSGVFPQGTRVYIPDMGNEPRDVFVKAAKRLVEHGYVPVPHFAARRLADSSALEDRVRALTEEAGVRDVLVIGGGLEKPVGEFGASFDVIGTGFFDKYGVTRIGIAGHPEGSPDFSEEIAMETLQLKQVFADRSDADLRIVTQFCFDGQAIVTWIETLERYGITLPVHIGVTGPCKIPTLLKYAIMCGVGNSLSVLKKQKKSMFALATGYSPEAVVTPLEEHWRSAPQSILQQLHVFPFGGSKKTAEWLKTRGSWADDNYSLEKAAN